MTEAEVVLVGQAPDRCPCLRPEPLACTMVSRPKASCPLRLTRHTCRRLVREPLAKNPGLIRRAGPMKQPRIADARDAQRRHGILPCTRICRLSCEDRTDRALPVAKNLDVPVADSSHREDLSPMNENPPTRLPTRRGPRLSKANMSRSTSGAGSGQLGFSRQTKRSLCCSNPLCPPRRQVRQVCSLTGPL
jgi:hypothetical protein